MAAKGIRVNGDQATRRSPARVVMVGLGVVALVVAAALIFRLFAGGGDEEVATPIEPAPTVSPTERVIPDAAATAVSAPTPTPSLTMGLPDLEAASDIEGAPLGRYIVARRDAGILRSGVPGQLAQREIPVYEQPFGPPRTLLDVNELDGVKSPIALRNLSDAEGVLVMRVVAGGPDDDWLLVQAPTRPHDSVIWVRRNDFDFGFTTMRLEIDLAPGGGLTLFDGDDEVLRTDIVHGRDSRPTPTHLTYIEKGVRGASMSPAYGTAVLSMASFSEALGTFGGGGLPSNFLHGTNQPELMGQRVSSGEIRVPNDVLDAIIETITPGTPVLMFNSAMAPLNKRAILQRPMRAAATVSFNEGAPAAIDGSTNVTPQLWHRCDPSVGDAALLCRLSYSYDGDGNNVYMTAKPGAGVFHDEVGGNVIPVYDTPGGSARMLVHEPADGYAPPARLPLRHPSRLGEPLVLWPLESTPDGEWVRVQAPVHPQRQSVWVRAADFDFAATDMRFEIDLAGQGELRLLDGDTEVLSNLIVSGRESRPTPLGASYIDQVVDGSILSPAYGSYVASFPIFSEVLGTFGGGAFPNLAIHGTNQPELMGQRVSSGNIRVPNEVLAFMVELPPGLIGARVVVFDSTGTTREAAIGAQENRRWRPALTTDPDDASLVIGVPLF